MFCLHVVFKFGIKMIYLLFPNKNKFLQKNIKTDFLSYAMVIILLGNFKKNI